MHDSTLRLMGQKQSNSVFLRTSDGHTFTHQDAANTTFPTKGTHGNISTTMSYGDSLVASQLKWHPSAQAASSNSGSQFSTQTSPIVSKSGHTTPSIETIVQPKFPSSHGTKKIDFLELFDDEVRVLSNLASIEGGLLQGKRMALDKDNLICLLMQESQRLEAERQRASKASFRSSYGNGHEPVSVTTNDGLEIVTSLLLKLKGLGGSTTEINKTLSTPKVSLKDIHIAVKRSIDSGLEERSFREGRARYQTDTLSDGSIIPSIDDLLNDGDSSSKDGRTLLEFMEDMDGYDYSENTLCKQEARDTISTHNDPEEK